MKKLFYVFAFVGALMLTACENEQNAQTDNTKLWAACEDGTTLVWGFIDKDGKMVISPKYDAAYGFSNGLCLVYEDKVCDFIDKDGKHQNAPEVKSYSSWFYNGQVNFQEGDKWGKMNTDFKTVVPADYSTLGATAVNGYSYFKETSGGKYGYIDKDGKVVIEEDFDDADDFVAGIAVVRVGEKDEARYGIINEKGEYTLDLQKKKLINLGNGLVAIQAANGKFGIIDKKGNEKLAATYDDINPFTYGLSLVEKNDKYGFINEKFDLVVPCSYYIAYPFVDEVTWVKKNKDDKYSVLDKKGNVLCKMKDDIADPAALLLMIGFSGGPAVNCLFHNGLALVLNTDGKTFRYIDKEGKKVYEWHLLDKVAEMPDFNPAKMDDMIKQAMMYTEFAPLFDSRLKD